MTRLNIEKLLGGEHLALRGPLIAVTNPATQKVVWELPSASKQDALDAIEKSASAFKPWSRRTAADRSKILRKWYELLSANENELATLITLEGGKPFAEAVGEVRYGAAYVEWFSEEARRAYGEVIPSNALDRRLTVMKEPVGVCAAITPWNFPLAMITRKVAPALAAGCTMLVKPSELTPLTALAVLKLAIDAGIPPGVFQVLPADEATSVQIGEAFCNAPLVRKLSFTGSTEVGRILMRQSSVTVKKLSLELGGNAPFIVFDDADLDAAVHGAIASKFRNAGQTCVCSNRFLVHRSVHKSFVDKFLSAVQCLKLGNGMDPGTDVGPLIDYHAIARIESVIKDAVAGGAKIVTGGSPSELGASFYEPTVLVDVSPESEIVREEIFGPVAPIVVFDTEEEAVELANASIYGLAAYFYSENARRCGRVLGALEFGMVGVNTGLISTEVAPFGGNKQSGFGREGGRAGLEDYMTMKYACSAV
ncbi:MAG: NAD-dependent succinate-semialdehyde dehydrogenase [Pseudomonadota bacterium]